MQLRKYGYRGPILVFDNVVSNNWTTTTYAISKKKAVNNIEYQARLFLGKTQKNKITLPGKFWEDRT